MVHGPSKKKHSVIESYSEYICKEVLGWVSLNEKDVNKTIGFIEAKEMTRDAMTQPAITASFSQKIKANHKKSRW